MLDYVNIWLGAIFNNRYEIDDLVSERKFSVNLNLQICFESNKPCDIDIQVFTNTKLPKKPCDWTTDFINEGELDLIKLDDQHVIKVFGSVNLHKNFY